MLKPIGPLSPFRRDLVMSLADASEHSGRALNTTRDWCKRYRLGRKLGGEWLVDRVAFHLFLEGHHDTLTRYLAGDRADPVVVETFERLGVLLTPPSARKKTLAGGAAHADA
jgi:hypothetical protein